MDTARDLKVEFDSIVKEVIAPIFIDLGFKRSGNHFFREIKSVIQAFNVQQSRWNSKDDKSFVLNLGLLDKANYRETMGRELPKFPKEYDCPIRVRLGDLMGKGDKWYYLNGRTNLVKLKEEVKIDLTSYALPFFEKYADKVNWIDFSEWGHGAFVSVFGRFFILEHCGKRGMAEDFLNEKYNEAITPKPMLIEHQNMDGHWTKKESSPTVDKEWVEKLEKFALDKGVQLKVRKQGQTSSKFGFSWFKNLFTSN